MSQSVWDILGLSKLPVVCTVATVVIFVPAVVALAVAGARRGDESWVLPAALVAFSLGWIIVGAPPDWWGRLQWPLIPVLAAVAATQAVGQLGSAASSSAQVHRRTPATVLAALACIGLLPFHFPAGSHVESPHGRHAHENGHPGSEASSASGLPIGSA